MKKAIGLTGGIATGKSSVTSFLRSQGFVVFDADDLVHDLQKVGGRLYNLIFSEFGSDYFDEMGEMKRQKLAEEVFSNPEVNQRLGKLQNSIIREEILKEKNQLSLEHDLFFMDIPLLIEESYQIYFDEIWLISAQPKLQLDRLMKRNLLTEKTAKERIAMQMSMDKKVKYADVVIDNSGSLKNLHEQILKQIEKLKNDNQY